MDEWYAAMLKVESFFFLFGEVFLSDPLLCAEGEAIVMSPMHISCMSPFNGGFLL